jgi:cell division protein FtsZ
MENEKFEVTEHIDANGVKIVVIGVGGAGSNMVDHLMQIGLNKNIKLAVANTDAQALESSSVAHKLQIGPKLTKGRGTGMKPEVGREAALESYDELKKLLVDLDK